MNTESGTLAELAKIRAEARSQVSKKEVVEELPVGEGNDKPAVEAAPEAPAPEVVAEAPVPAVAAEPEEETLIRIGDKTFKTQSEAIKYAEQLEQEKEVSQAYNAGIQEALKVTRPAVVEEPKEDKFEEEFYTNPKETLKKIKEEAKAEFRAEQQQNATRESLWNQFLNENPDIDRADAQMILDRDWETIRYLDAQAAMKIVAKKTRAYYQGIIERSKPRVELPNKAAQVVSPSASVPASVTPQKKEEKPLDFISQLKANRRK